MLQQKKITQRKAIAFGIIKVSSDVISIIKSDAIKKVTYLMFQKLLELWLQKIHQL